MSEHEITGIKAQKRNPDRVNIFLEGEYAFGLSKILAAWLTVGQRITDEKIHSLREQDEFEVAYQAALKLLDYKARTQKEIRQKLQEKGFSASMADQVLQRLNAAGLVNDSDYARSWVENRNEAHPRGRKLIGLELRRKGIEDDVIDEVLSNSASDAELATRAADRQAHRLEGLEWPEFRTKLSAYLLRRGFNYGTVAPVVHFMWESTRDASSKIKNEESEKC